MITLIPDFARVITEANRRAAASVDAGVQRIEGLRQEVETALEKNGGWDTLRRRVAREARAATHNLIAAAGEVDELWSAAVASLKDGPSAQDQIETIQVFSELTASCREFQESVRRLWELVERMGDKTDSAEGLADAGRLIDRIHAETVRAVECRTTEWRPSDPARYERGKQEIREGKSVGPDELLQRFRKQAQ